ncbi:hypothetical protein NLJ89_g6132 [Agrocybe chaxingu]|uniref:Uncharacterized protein n=1 Tax=Agrocybe chaxingu TaxID=84603 RepID=A0A9W8K659_9AGAR|nr:hypothetical protein NLJ89_g6132 [Agrocybe chaxingu]
MSLRPDASRTGGMILQAFLYGLYVVSVFQALSTLLRDHSKPPCRWKKRSDIHWLTLSVCLLLWANGTLNVCLGLVRTLRVDRIFEEEELSGWLNLIRGSNCSLQILLADGILIYRAWVVTSRDLRFIALPLFLWAAGLASCITGLVFQARSSLLMPSRNLIIMYDVWTVFWTVTVALNIYCTSLIAYRVWKAYRMASSNRVGRSPLFSVVVITIESGLLYTITSIFACVSTITKSDSIFTTTAADIIMIGIAFNLIIICVGQRRVVERDKSGSQPGGVMVTTIRFEYPDHPRSHRNFEMEPIAERPPLYEKK